MNLPNGIIKILPNADRLSFALLDAAPDATGGQVLSGGDFML